MYAPEINEGEPPGTEVIQVQAVDYDPPEKGGKQQQHWQINLTRFALKFMIIIFYSRHDNIQFGLRTRRPSQIRDRRHNRIDPNDQRIWQGQA